MADPVRRIRLVRGTSVPIPPSERVDGRAELTREGTATVHDRSWVQRMIAKGDLADAPEAPDKLAELAAKGPPADEPTGETRETAPAPLEPPRAPARGTTPPPPVPPTSTTPTPRKDGDR